MIPITLIYNKELLDIQLEYQGCNIWYLKLNSGIDRMLGYHKSRTLSPTIPVQMANIMNLPYFLLFRREVYPVDVLWV